jgi:hypothetical protein
MGVISRHLPPGAKVCAASVDSETGRLDGTPTLILQIVGDPIPEISGTPGIEQRRVSAVTGKVEDFPRSAALRKWARARPRQARLSSSRS